MDQDRGLIEEGLAALRGALSATTARHDLHLAPRTITKAAARSVRAALRQAETLLRRLVLLLAASLSPPPARPSRHGAHRAARPATGPRVSLFRQHRYDGAALEALRARPVPVPRPGPVPAAPMIARLHSLFACLDNPHPLALRLARRLLAMRKRGDPRPMVRPQPKLFRCHHRLGLVAAILPDRITEAFEGWYEPG